MVKRDEIVKFLNSYLEIEKFKDSGTNGLQVPGKGEVGKIALGVSASLELFQQANRKGADMIVVHHGLLWEGSQWRISRLLKGRLKFLFDDDISLLGYHLPLDAHPEIGNNAQIAKKLDIKIIGKFGEYKGEAVGWEGTFKKPRRFDGLLKEITKVFGFKPWYLKGGENILKTVAIVSGGGASIIPEVIDKKIDVYITGETGEFIPQAAKEGGINYIAAGHYNTEKFGIQALGEVVKKKFPTLEIKFIDIPNPL